MMKSIGVRRYQALGLLGLLILLAACARAAPTATPVPTPTATAVAKRKPTGVLNVLVGSLSNER